MCFRWTARFPALTSSAWSLVFYWGIILWELVTAILLCWGTVALVRALRGHATQFNAARGTATIALALSLFLWLVAFLDIGGEWFLMWQSAQWNGQAAAARNFTVVGIVLLLLLQPETEAEP